MPLRIKTHKRFGFVGIVSRSIASSIKGTIDISLNGILFVPDYKSTFEDEVVAVELQNGELVAEQKKTQITNDIWDGESLLDESLFAGTYADKHFLLLRNKFFNSCDFKTKLQKWLKDKNVSLDCMQGDRFELMYKMTAFYGLRRSKLCGMQWSSIDFEKNTLTLNHSVCKLA